MRSTFFWVFKIRSLLFRVLYWGPLFSETPKLGFGVGYGVQDFGQRAYDMFKPFFLGIDMYIYMYTYACTYLFPHLEIYIHIYIYMYTHTHSQDLVS